MRRGARPAVTLAITAACAAYLVWKIDLGQTLHVLREVQAAYFVGALAILFATIPPLAWRWRLLLRARGIDDHLPWLMRAYLVSYAAGQVLPTSLGGDATRIFETTRRHPGRGGAVAGSVLLERVLGGFATLVLAAAGFVLGVRPLDVGAYLWIELAFVVAAALASVVLFFALGPAVAGSARARVAARVARATGAGGVRGDARLPQRSPGAREGVCRNAGPAGRTRDDDLAGGEGGGRGPLAATFFVMGPLLFLVMLVPLTINGFALRETFFVSFLGNLGVGADRPSRRLPVFLLSTALALPGAAILVWQSFGASRAKGPDRAVRLNASG